MRLLGGLFDSARSQGAAGAQRLRLRPHARVRRRRRAVLDQGVTGSAPVEIDDGAWLGENVVVGPGVRIGRGAVVGANSVVTGRASPTTRVAVGAPARRRAHVCSRAGAGALKRVLFHSYYFPPIGGAGAQRPLKMVRYLEGSGTRSVSSPDPGATSDRWAPSDATLSAASCRATHRVASGTRRPSRRRARAAGACGALAPLRARWTRWWVNGAVERASRRQPDVDLVYVWMQPYVSADAGVRLARELIGSHGSPTSATHGRSTRCWCTRRRCIAARAAAMRRAPAAPPPRS